LKKIFSAVVSAGQVVATAMAKSRAGARPSVARNDDAVEIESSPTAAAAKSMVINIVAVKAGVWQQKSGKGPR